MFVREKGTGADVLLLHGAPASPHDFQPLVDRLVSKYRVLVPDMPGYGQSRFPSGDYTWERSIEMVEESLVARGVSSLRAVVGFGEGANRALSIALRGRIPVGAVVSLGGFATLEASTRAGLNGLAQVIKVLPHLRDHTIQQFYVTRALSPEYAASHPDEVDRVMNWLNETTPFALGWELDALSSSEDLSPRLPGLKVPVLVRVGSLDQTFPVALSDQLARALPDASLQIIPGKGHALLIEDLDATVDAIASFLERGQ
ncbi:MAG: alpha/beta hydrolase [Myxococcaceae bacterium]